MIPTRLKLCTHASTVSSSNALSPTMTARLQNRRSSKPLALWATYVAQWVLQMSIHLMEEISTSSISVAWRSGLESGSPSIKSSWQITKTISLSGPLMFSLELLTSLIIGDWKFGLPRSVASTLWPWIRWNSVTLTLIGHHATIPSKVCSWTLTMLCVGSYHYLTQSC